jgi:hypothetical protein
VELNDKPEPARAGCAAEPQALLLRHKAVSRGNTYNAKRYCVQQAGYRHGTVWLGVRGMAMWWLCPKQRSVTEACTRALIQRQTCLRRLWQPSQCKREWIR